MCRRNPRLSSIDDGLKTFNCNTTQSFPSKLLAFKKDGKLLIERVYLLKYRWGMPRE